MKIYGDIRIMGSNSVNIEDNSQSIAPLIVVNDAERNSLINHNIKATIGGGDRALFVGGYEHTPRYTEPWRGGYNMSDIQYCGISIPQNANSFGSLMSPELRPAITSNSARNRAVIIHNEMFRPQRYMSTVNISSLGNAVFFADHVRLYPSCTSTSNGINNRALIQYSNKIDLLSIISFQDAQVFASVLDRSWASSLSNGVNNVAVFGMGTDAYLYVSSVNILTGTVANSHATLTNYVSYAWHGSLLSNGHLNTGIAINGHTGNKIEQFNIVTGGSCTLFGIHTNGSYYFGSTSNGSGNIGLILGSVAVDSGNVIEYINISTPSNSMDFGDLTKSSYNTMATSNSDTGGTVDDSDNNGLASGDVVITLHDHAINLFNSPSRNFIKISSDTYNDYIPDSVGANVLFIGGKNKTILTDIIDYFNGLFLGDAKFFSNLSDKIHDHTSTSNNFFGGRSLTFGGDISREPYHVTNITAIEMSVVSSGTLFGCLQSRRYGAASTSNGVRNKALISGGCNSNTRIRTIESCNIMTFSDSFLFGDLTTTSIRLQATSNGYLNTALFTSGESSVINVNLSSCFWVNMVSNSNAVAAAALGDATTARRSGALTSNRERNYALYIGGIQNNAIILGTTSRCTNIEAHAGFTDTFSYISCKRYGLAATTSYFNAVFAGGEPIRDFIEITKIFTTSTSNIFGNLTLNRKEFSAVSES